MAWLLLRIYKLLPRETSAPSVPPQHNFWPLTMEESFAFPPETPSGELAPCAFCCGGTIVTSTESIAVLSACEIAVTTTSLVCPSLFPLASTGTEFGALNSPVAGTSSASPLALNPPVQWPLLAVRSAPSQNTFWSIVPCTVAANVCDPPLFHETVAGATITLLVVGGGVPLLPLLVPLQEIKYGQIIRLAIRERVRRIGSLVLRAGPLTLAESI